jgi:hypothetical protein
MAMATDMTPTAPQQPAAPAATPGALPKPAAPARPATTSVTQRLLALGEIVSLALAVLTLVGCAAILFVFLGSAIAQTGTIKLPESTGNQQDDNLNFSRFTTQELYRQQARSEERTGVLRSCGVLVGVAIAFLALTLFLAAARAEAGAPDQPPTTAGRLARLAPGLAALACATIIITISAPESKPAAPSGGLPVGLPYTLPQVGFPSPPAG